MNHISQHIYHGGISHAPVIRLVVAFLALLCGGNLQAQSNTAASLAGNWKMVASPFDGGSEEIAFTATPSADGTSLQCHADRFVTRASQPYTADWMLTVEQNDGNVRVGWQLSADTPITTQEYQESADKYIMGGRDADGTHRYIYLLSENIETQRLEPLTLWSDWQPEGTTTFTLPKTQQIYAVVSPYQPYNGSVGYVEIWASVTLQQVSSSSAIGSIAADRAADATIYSLQGIRLNSLQKGLNIVNGKKIVK